MHVLDTLTQGLHPVYVEQKQTVDEITDRIHGLKKALALLQITIDSTHSDPDEKIITL